VRRSAGVDWQGGSYRQKVLLADVALDGELDAGVAHAVPAPEGVLLLFPLGERAAWRLIATRPRNDTDRDAAGQLDEWSVPFEDIRTIIDRSGLGARLTDVAWSSAVPIQHRIASRYRSESVFVVGDAAHCHSPAGGQGMNMGIQDAVNLGWKLGLAARADSRRRAAADFLLDSYESERRPVGRRVLAMTDMLFWAEAGTDPVASFARSVLAPVAAPAIPFLLARRRLVARGVRVLSQLVTSYRRSPLSIEDTPLGRQGSRPGERMPDQTVSVQGRRLQMHELLATSGFDLLLEQGSPSPQVGVDHSVVRVHRIEDWKGAGVVIVRPDGYVGYRSAIADGDRIREWLAMIAA
jgi:hypothetical protein